MKKLNFKIILINIVNKKPSLKEVEGYQIDSLAAVYREQHYWTVIDLETGLCICKGKTMKNSINKYQEFEMQERIKNSRKTDSYRHLKNIFEELKGQN